MTQVSVWFIWLVQLVKTTSSSVSGQMHSNVGLCVMCARLLDQLAGSSNVQVEQFDISDATHAEIDIKDAIRSSYCCCCSTPVQIYVAVIFCAQILHACVFAGSLPQLRRVYSYIPSVYLEVNESHTGQIDRLLSLLYWSVQNVKNTKQLIRCQLL